MLLVANKSSFYKKGVGKIKFICVEGEAAKKLINLTKKNITHKAWLKAKGIDETGDIVSEFDFEWSCKKKIKWKKIFIKKLACQSLQHLCF